PPLSTLSLHDALPISAVDDVNVAIATGWACQALARATGHRSAPRPSRRQDRLGNANNSSDCHDTTQRRGTLAGTSAHRLECLCRGAAASSFSGSHTVAQSWHFVSRAGRPV